MPLAPADRSFLQQPEATVIIKREKGCGGGNNDVEANQALQHLVALAAARPVAADYNITGRRNLVLVIAYCS